MTQAETAAKRRFEEKMTKSYGAQSMRRGGTSTVYDPISTGVLGLDLALGVGGYVPGRITQIWGFPDSGKTSLCLMGMAQSQRKFPNKMVAFIDVENKWDDKWAETLGVDRSRCYLFRPPTAEDTADMVKDCLASGMMSMVVIDSVGAMMGRVEQEKQADEATVAVVARIVTRMVKHVTSLAPEKQTAVLVCNQVRQEVSSMGGQVLPGGWALRHANSAQIRLRASTRPEDVLTIKRNGEDVPVGRKIAAKIERNKMAAPGVTAFFTFINQSSEAYGPVGVDPGSEAAMIGERFGMVERSGSWYTLTTTGERFQGLEKLREALRVDPESVAAIRSAALESLRSALVSDAPEADEEPEAPVLVPGVPLGTDVLVISDTDAEPEPEPAPQGAPEPPPTPLQRPVLLDLPVYQVPGAQ